MRGATASANSVVSLGVVKVRPQCSGLPTVIVCHGSPPLLLGERRAVEVDVKRDDFVIPHSKYLGYIAFECRTTGPLKLVSSQGARFVPIDKRLSHFERDNPTVEAFRGFEIGWLPRYLLHGTGEAGEDDIVG